MMTPWVQIDLQGDAAGRLLVSVSADARGRSTAPRPTEGLVLADIERFSQTVLARSRQGLPLTQDQERFGRILYRSVMGGEVGQIVDQLRGEGGGQLLLRLMISDSRLRAVPWEAMRGPADIDGALASHPAIRVTRGVFSTEAAIPREVRGALRVLTIASDEMAYAVEDLRRGLDAAIGAGEIAWMEPAVGVAARWNHLFSRLQRLSPRPHILHFLCHGRVGEGGEPELLLDPDEERWTSVSTLATALSATIADDLRLIYLEACAGAQPGALASAAEHFAARGVDAVVAHLCPVSAPAARTVANNFYRALGGPARGDVAVALNTARLALEGNRTAEFVCPVLVLQGRDPVLFDFSRRRLEPTGMTGKVASVDPRHQALRADLERRLSRPATLLVGEYVDDEGVGRSQIEKEVLAVLEREDREPLSALLQRYQFEEEREDLREVVQDVLGRLARDAKPEAAGLVRGLAALAGPGLFLTLLWLPLLEDALALAHPDKEILVYQPIKPGGVDRLRLFWRDPATGRWDKMRREPERLDFDRQMVVLRLYGGYTAAQGELLGDPVLTDDDHLVNLSSIEGLPRQILAWLRNNPMNIVGYSPMAWAHREMLRRLLGGQPLVPGSFAVLEPGAGEARKRYWMAEDGPAGRAGGVELAGFADVAAALGG